MGHILFQYRSRPLEEDDLTFIREIISCHYDKGRSYIPCPLRGMVMAAAKWGSERICRQRPFITFGRARVHQFAAPPA